ncbi:MAG: hypothetical protein CL823_03425 [Crocinitomicaceae bacterium]|nr:hypothetical protein [Crocinitomicaceae bacterium]|tara:strand:- start:3475 stop:3831 length:357 start_codon:yes stop_codon:yes gene_type:complete
MLFFCKTIIFLGIINVWFVRRKSRTNWRGGDSLTLKDEFKFYALPNWTFYLVGATKILSALLIFLSIWIDEIPHEFFSLILSSLMIFAILMHLKVGDKLVKSLPAFCMLLFAVITLNI